jgi:hypothetical protein
LTPNHIPICQETVEAYAIGPDEIS